MGVDPVSTAHCKAENNYENDDMSGIDMNASWHEHHKELFMKLSLLPGLHIHWNVCGKGGTSSRYGLIVNLLAYVLYITKNHNYKA